MERMSFRSSNCFFANRSRVEEVGLLGNVLRM